ncbi:DegT/DnrJ/EryC1/StrS family aminotransferase [Algoriphagus limi]|uniref:DegT/DnrJ/EryC1/StrS family aminotransferase n=1 Tax=Algoriphagus limi TaxID=2975273 RepID=A0ABT2G1P4_9BACT|nr:DegT/DnrJ/EryC1/StrS family aminotransferase [Algoriphagus limi]MCS5489198.1 DegT/DnrJ/EryC1/StrS family aminotransferase [Algoriphagus limi]
MIPVTKTFFPPLEEYQSRLERIWKNQWLTNNGELLKELSLKLKNYLGVKNIIPTTNGTLPIQIALKVFGKEGEIITTPFSYVATSASIIWENCKPVFVDIHPDYLTIDESKIEEAITKRTTAILATHVYGNPCNVKAIESIANRYNLKVIYDAAHCFGVTFEGKSIFNFGDVSTCSFHATKIFHTGEGGALFCQNEETYSELHYRHNFGHKGKEKYFGLGINAKMSELQAAMGLCVLPYMDYIFSERKRVCEYYDRYLDFSKLSTIKIRQGTEWNYSYYPVIFSSESSLLEVKKRLESQKIFPRRYFFPSLEQLPYIESHNCKIAEDIASRILCLPIYAELTELQLSKIVDSINHD